MTTVAFAVTAAAFVFVCGANDGGALLALALRHQVISAAALIGVLAGAVVVGPWLGLAVARTFTEQLTSGTDTQRTVLVGAAVATALVLLLTWRGIPTSITLALIGGLAGASTGRGTPPLWGTLGLVLLIGALAPVAGIVVGYALAHFARRVPTNASMARAVDASHIAAYSGQCLAYALNDGQKMFAVVGVALAAGQHTATSAPLASLPLNLAVAAVFAVGATAGLRRVLRGTTGRLVAARGWQVVSAEVASSVAVLGSSGLGVPVSMTQSVTGGLIGVGSGQGLRRVRWRYALPIMTAWVVTLPASFVSGVLAGLALEGF